MKKRPVYKSVTVHDHPRATTDGRVREHVLIAEKALGRYLPDHAEVHHADLDYRNNDPGNLVICENDSYHKILHVRTRVLHAGGNPDTDKICCICGSVLHSSLFSKRHTTYDGLAPHCKFCSYGKRKPS